RLRRPASGAPVGDFSAAAMQQSVEDSLRRLRTDYIDVLYLHAPRRDSLGNVEPLLEALASLRQAGKVRRVGISGLAAECAPIARGYPELAEMLQIELLADSQGFPDIVSLPPATAVASWELPGSRAPATGFTLSRHFERLQRALPAGLVLLSTPDGRAIRQASDFFSQELSGAGA
ncbi:MAG: aldo/keto reductase, partial [Steroidobacteraceae bacterium]